MTTAQATVEVFFRAFQTLTKSEKSSFISKLLSQKSLREDMMDLATIEKHRHEPRRPLKEYFEERKKRSKK